MRVEFAMSGDGEISIHFGWTLGSSSNQAGFLGAPDLDEWMPGGPFRRPPEPCTADQQLPSHRGGASRRDDRELRNVLS